MNLLLKNILQEKRQLVKEKCELNMFLHSTLENNEEENRKLNLLLKKSLHIITICRTQTVACKHNEPQNAETFWEKHQAGQDCVDIVPPRCIGEENWLNCLDARQHFLCETTALSLT